MPEGDTIHKTARRLRDALAGHRVVRFEMRRDPHGVRAPEPGTTIETIDARGKHLLMTFDDGATLHTHMQMTGAWHTYRPGERWRRAAHRARVIIEVDTEATAVCFDAPVVELTRSGRVSAATRAKRALERLGPDLATSDVDLDVVMRNLERVDPEAEIGTVLLDQRIAGGIGNVFKSEILWRERVDPFTPIGAIDAETRRRLYERAHTFIVANLQTRRRVTFQGGYAVYRKAKRPCPRCRTPIRMLRQGDPPRSTYWCPVCQPVTDGVSSPLREA
ncbi:MAG TPA: DNA-formamidopyrimidine glycosylase family protein [Acidimicrobiia bacterium]|nr:DNA-formamidopyrimidine glycosylase family protein [Acidimicrobiia bacterium]